MGKEIGHAPSTVHRIWRALGLQPHRVETFKLSSEPLFVEKVRDIVGLYLSPRERAVVLCFDEKSRSRHSTARSRCCRCGLVGPKRRTHDYKRHGAQPLSGRQLQCFAISLRSTGHIPNRDSDPASAFPGWRAHSCCTAGSCSHTRIRDRRSPTVLLLSRPQARSTRATCDPPPHSPSQRERQLRSPRHGRRSGAENADRSNSN